MAEESTARVLCVDDNPDVVESTAALLEAGGYEVRTATDPVEAIHLAQEFRPHACVLDVSMPGMSGYELAPRLRQVLERVFLVAVTATSGGDHDHKVNEAGFARRLVKPADPLVLLDTLKRGTREAA